LLLVRLVNEAMSWRGQGRGHRERGRGRGQSSRGRGQGRGHKLVKTQKQKDLRKS